MWPQFGLVGCPLNCSRRRSPAVAAFLWSAASLARPTYGSWSARTNGYGGQAVLERCAIQVWASRYGAEKLRGYLAITWRGHRNIENEDDDEDEYD